MYTNKLLMVNFIRVEAFNTQCDSENTSLSFKYKTIETDMLLYFLH